MKIETKFNLNEEVWMMKDNKPFSFNIYDIRITSGLHDLGNYQSTIHTSIEYRGYGSITPDWISENKLYRTKEELKNKIFGENE